MNDGIIGYEVREDVFVDGTTIFDVFQTLENGDAEYVDSFYDEVAATAYAETCAKDNGIEGCEVKVRRGE